MPKKQIPLEVRFHRLCNSTPNEKGCIEWIGAKTPKGYGVFRVGDGKTEQSHRVAMRIYNKDADMSLHVLHSCDNPACVNPTHLRLGTHQENMRDMKNKNRSRVPILRGEKHPLAVLSDQLVLSARERAKQGESIRAIARSLGLAQSTLTKAVSGERWSHL